MGLSPLTRGNLALVFFINAMPRPIPAHAGEPWPSSMAAGRAGAYPRSRGGTCYPTLAEAMDSGLSPLTRGNPNHLFPISVCQGPIPAHAGEPAMWRIYLSRLRAYPRSRGGTVTRIQKMVAVPGLSPLTRGNRRAAKGHSHAVGPIPAHAGEPLDVDTPRIVKRAYPRSRGGTNVAQMMTKVQEGLSPLTRGNRGEDAIGSAQRGPIPAHAGEPNTAKRKIGEIGAYPRSRGGTPLIFADSP